MIDLIKMINRAYTHKKIEVTNETYAKLMEFRHELFLARTKVNDFKNVGFDEAIKISLTLAKKEMRKDD